MVRDWMIGYDVVIVRGPARGATGMLWDIDGETCSVKRYDNGRLCAAETYNVRDVHPTDWRET